MIDQRNIDCTQQAAMQPATQVEWLDAAKVKREKDAIYEERNRCVAGMARLALACGLKAWLGRHDFSDQTWEDDWRNIVFIDLPTGQVSWHIHDSQKHLFDFLPERAIPWDGHTTPVKYKRLRDICYLDDHDLNRRARY